MRTAPILFGLVLLASACGQDAPPPLPTPTPTAPVPAPTPVPVPTPDVAPPTPPEPAPPVEPAPAASVRQPDWPCGATIENTLGALSSTERFEFEYTGPERCSQLPPDLSLVGCVTRETRTVGPNVRVRTFQYDEGGRLTHVEYSSGTRLTVLWSPDGRLAGMEIDGDGDGTRDEVVTYRHERNAIVWERDRGGDGTPDARARYRVDRRGRELGVLNDRGADGSDDLRGENVYEGTRLVSSTLVALPDENVVSRTEYLYDCPAAPAP